MMKITKARLRELIQEELATEGYRTDMSMPALSPEDFEGAGLGDLQSDEKFTGGSPEERLLTLMKAREVLAKMGKEELSALSMSLDADQVAVLRHILANPMYAPMEESNAEAQDLIRKAEFEKSKGRLHQGDVDRIKARLAAGESPHSIKRDYRRNF